MKTVKRPERYWHAVTAHDAHVRRSCEVKISYSSERHTRSAGMGRLRELGDDITKLWCYPCPACKGWHLTSVPHPTSVAITSTARWEGVQE